MRLKSRLKAAVQNQAVPADLEARLRQSLRQANRSSSSQWIRWAGAAAAVLIAAVVTWIALPARRNTLVLPDIADRPAQNVYIEKVSAGLSTMLKVGLGD